MFAGGDPCADDLCDDLQHLVGELAVMQGSTCPRAAAQDVLQLTSFLAERAQESLGQVPVEEIGLGNRSYTNCMRNLIRCGSDLHSSPGMSGG